MRSAVSLMAAVIVLVVLYIRLPQEDMGAFQRSCAGKLSWLEFLRKKCHWSASSTPNSGDSMSASRSLTSSHSTTSSLGRITCYDGISRDSMDLNLLGSDCDTFYVAVIGVMGMGKSTFI